MKYAERLHSAAAGYMLLLKDKCREKIQGTIGIGLTHDAGGAGAFRVG